MKNILARANRDVLEQLVWSNVLIAIDFDGTLAPIVVEPADAWMRECTRALLTQLATLSSVVIISGRAQPDILKKVRGVGIREVIGNHGIEPSFVNDRHAFEVQRWRPAIEACIADLHGVSIEDKVFSVAVHYRKSREKKRARAAIVKMAATLGSVRVIEGKQVINILPHDAPHKGIALAHARARLQFDTAIYIGDDETDEDVFALDQPGRLLTIRVGAKQTSAAAYYVPNQRAIDQLLALLIALHREDKQLPRALR